MTTSKSNEVVKNNKVRNHRWTNGQSSVIKKTNCEEERYYETNNYKTLFPYVFLYIHLCLL